MECLLVEDDANVSDLVRRSFERIGWHTDAKTTVADAVGALQQRRYDVVLLDIVLKQDRGRPDQNGLDVAREMRRLGISTPFVVMTGELTFHHGLEVGELHPAAVVTKSRSSQPIVDACQAAAAAAFTTTADPQARAREELAALDLKCADDADRCSAVLLRAVGHPAITLYQCMPLHLELVRLGRANGELDLARLMTALQCPPQSGHADIDFLLSILSAGHVANNQQLASAGGCSVKWARQTLKHRTGHGPTKWRCLSRAADLVERLLTSRDDIGQCADRAGYRYVRECVPECRRLFGRTPGEVRKLQMLG